MIHIHSILMSPPRTTSLSCPMVGRAKKMLHVSDIIMSPALVQNLIIAHDMTRHHPDFMCEMAEPSCPFLCWIKFLKSPAFLITWNGSYHLVNLLMTTDPCMTSPVSVLKG